MKYALSQSNNGSCQRNELLLSKRLGTMKQPDGLQIGHSLDKEKDIKIACDVVHLKLFLQAGSDAAIP